jgi:hypothetical protein
MKNIARNVLPRVGTRNDSHSDKTQPESLMKTEERNIYLL